ncbi:MAG: hypothetical protein DI551_09335 [Micavibrio aeruginosavorus]|uniref:Uncharacterized protein n=1 Tax=Micavibrio aeruginosavorus TaxID=349221 RepID=A0A2W5Q0H7_9BACT|nr:MAG: hypothetical protein DI551_09335 [Micavibrio aeruginosavorus]
MIHPFQNLLCILFGSFATTLTFSIFGNLQSYQFLFVVFVVALGHGLLLGLPAYLIVPKKFKNHWLSPLLIGFLIGTVWPLYFSADAVLGNIFKPSYLNDVRQTGALKEDLLSIASGGFLGMIGAMSTWSMWMYFQKNVNQAKD